MYTYEPAWLDMTNDQRPFLLHDAYFKILRPCWHIASRYQVYRSVKELVRQLVGLFHGWGWGCSCWLCFTRKISAGAERGCLHSNSGRLERWLDDEMRGHPGEYVRVLYVGVA